MDHKISVTDAVVGLGDSARSLTDRLDRVLMVIRGAVPVPESPCGASPLMNSGGVMSDLERLAMHIQNGQNKIDELERVIGNPAPKQPMDVRNNAVGPMQARY